MIEKRDTGFLYSCDGCSNQVLLENESNWKSANEKMKEAGWLNRKIDGEWCNFCSDECYKNRVAADQAKLNEAKADELNPNKNPDWKCATFKIELEFIENPALKTLAQQLLNQTPDYFFNVPASSTGKYHPKYALGNGGLVRHTKAAIRIAMELLRLDIYKQLKPVQDLIVIALMLHDSWKHGPKNGDSSHSSYTTFSHPKVAAEFVRNSTLADEQILNYIGKLIETHMGQWTTNFSTQVKELDEPQTSDQKFVHLCDYLASRKCLEFDETIEYSHD